MLTIVLKMLFSLLEFFRIFFRRTKIFLLSEFVKFSCAENRGFIYANRYSRVTKSTYLGRNIHFNGMKIQGTGKVVIGDNFHSGSECQIISDYHDYDNGDSIPYDSKRMIKTEINIKDNVWLGNRVIILGRVTIGEGAIIQAGSVVVSSIPDFAIAGGHPAKVFKTRDIEHYKKLKENEKFN